MPTVTSSGGFKPSTTDTPLDARTRVNTYAEIKNIQNPYINMEITVLSDETNHNEKTKYEVVSLLANEQGIENSIIDLSTLRRKVELYSEDEDIVFNGGSDAINTINFATQNELHSHANKEVLDGITSEKALSWDNKSDFSGDYSDLRGTPTLPTRTSELRNDSNFVVNTIADVPMSDIIYEVASVSGNMSYMVKNGICYVSIWGVTGTTVEENIISNTMPKAEIQSGQMLSATINNSIVGFAYINDTTLKLSIFTTNTAGYASFSYPVAIS